MQSKTKVNMTLNTEVVKKIRELAEKDNRKFSNMVDTILKEYLVSKGVM